MLYFQSTENKRIKFRTSAPPPHPRPSPPIGGEGCALSLILFSHPSVASSTVFGMGFSPLR